MFANKWWVHRKRSATTTPRVFNDIAKIDSDHSLHGYFGFKFYFKPKEFIDVTPCLTKIRAFESYIKRNANQFPFPEIREHKVFTVDLSSLLADNEFHVAWADFKLDLSRNTRFVLSCMAIAMLQQVIIEEKVAVLHPRLINHEPITPLKNLKTNTFGTLVSIRGTVVKASITRQLCVKEMAFNCVNCNGSQLVEQLDGAYTIPTSCPTKGCKSQSSFTPIFNSFTVAPNWQCLKVQELIGVGCYENGRVPRTIDCELSDDLVGCCIPGDDVTITGIIMSRSDKKHNQASVFHIYINVINVVNAKSQSNGSVERITFNTADYYAIQRIHARPSLFRYLVQSQCPNIYGNEIVKAGLLLTMFGGTSVEAEERFRLISHVLMVGDPGLGKSQMLLACANVAPRGVYVCGNTSTSSGLTVTMKKESSGDYSLEAGALILADRGCLCIDEFDKMTSQHTSLLEAMEQQSISIAKAGVMCNLSSRCSIFAAANPVGGHYNKAKTVAENLKISSPLISRFDLVFVLMDQSCKKYDQLVSEKVLGLHSKLKRPLLTQSITNATGKTLQERLMATAGDTDHLEHSLFRKYIAYAQRYVHPTIALEAKEILEQFYLELRKYRQENNCSPITVRQLESMMRLTKARAKAELREEATVEDAIDVLEIMRNSFIDIFTDETDRLDFRRSQGGSGMSKEKQLKALLSCMQSRAEELMQNEFTREEIRQLAEEVGIGRETFGDVLQKLNFHGYLLKRAQNKYKLASVDF
uniref:DNA helicase MCM8 n=1 Tax=Photinus pyralis TaxID=7054 RepID=A0A1Y1K104_PHOPY